MARTLKVLRIANKAVLFVLLPGETSNANLFEENETFSCFFSDRVTNNPRERHSLLFCKVIM